MEGVSGIAFNEEKNPQVKFACCMSVESIYHFRNLNVILPYLFLSNLLQSVVSGSKTVSAVNGMLHPSGSYPTIQSWLEEQGKELLESPPGDLVTFFDNIGKYIINNYRVRSKKSKSADIVSTTLHIILNKNSTLQSQIELKPNNWFSNQTESSIQEMMCEFLEKCSVNFRKYRYYYLLQKLEKVVNEDNKINERIKYLNKSAPRICANNCCNKEFTTCKRKCDLCGSKIVTANVSCSTDNLENQTSSVVASKYI